MQGGEGDVGTVQCTVGINSKTFVTGNLEGYGAGLSYDKMSAFRIE